jgi:acyl-homoserine lactone acylase PvdQ
MRFKYHQLEFLGYAGFERRWAERLLREGWPVGGEDARAVSPVSTIQRSTRPSADLSSGSLTRFAGDIRGPLGDIPRGSNEWAVAPSRTADGRAMLLVNPHQSFFGVERYLEIHLHSDEGLVFSGLTRFGFLLPYMGNNDRLGWTYTDNFADISDLYLEIFDDSDDPLRYRYGDERRTAETWTETVQVKVGGATDAGAATGERTLRFWKTHHGSIVGVDDESRPLAVRIAKLEEGGWLDQLDAMIRSRSLAEFRAAIARLGVPYMNTMYADADGNIWYIYNSAVPRRDPSFDWRRPVDGSDPRTEWGDYHPLEDLPQVLNPPSGWLLNTNSSPMVATDSVPYALDDFPPYMIYDDEDNWRARSSRRVLEGLDKVTFDDFARAVLDTRLSFADSILPVIASQWERLQAAEAAEVPAVLAPGAPSRAAVGDAVARLLAWDRVADIGSVETTWFVISLERWFADSRSGVAQGPFSHLEPLAATLAGLEKDHGRTEVTWGEISRLQRPPSQDPDDFSKDLPSLPVAGAPSAVGSVFVFHTVPFTSTDVRHGVHGNSFVKVIEFGPQARGRSVLVFGQSGDSESPHFFDQAPLYSERRFKPAWFTREEVEANATRSYRPGAASDP